MQGLGRSGYEPHKSNVYFYEEFHLFYPVPALASVSVRGTATFDARNVIHIFHCVDIFMAGVWEG